MTEGKKFNPASPAEGQNLPKEFPLLTQEDFKEIYKLFLKLFGKLGNKFPKESGFRNYTGSNESAGNGLGNFYNTSQTFYQLLFALAMTRHPLVKAITVDDFDVSKFDDKSMVENRIMAGMKILDLGSGPKPVFAQSCRAMGADVWTVDLDPRNSANVLELQKHIQLDLTDDRAIEVIKQKSGGEFHLVTEANLTSEGFYEGKRIAWPLLKTGGVHYVMTAQLSPELKE